MKRLTWQNYDMCQFCGEGACCEHYCDNTFPVCDDKAIYDRLAVIEDILGDEYDLDRLRELLEAGKGLEPSEIAESKLLIATRKDPEKLARMAELVEADRVGRCVVLPCKVEDDVYINILGRTLPFTVISISQMASTPTFKAQHGIRLVYIFKADDVGKTVFLTRAEAQAALRREQE